MTTIDGVSRFFVTSDTFEKSIDITNYGEGVAGQLKNSGKSNVVIIKDCDFINLEKIRDCSKCQEIMQFIDRVILK